MRSIYLSLAVLGAIVPYTFFVQYMAANPGLDPLGFLSALFANGAAGGFTVDLLITSFVFWIAMWQRRAVGPKPWPFVVLNLAIGLSCALPAYLYFEERRKSTLRSAKTRT